VNAFATIAIHHNDVSRFASSVIQQTSFSLVHKKKRGNPSTGRRSGIYWHRMVCLAEPEHTTPYFHPNITSEIWRLGVVQFLTGLSCDNLYHSDLWVFRERVDISAMVFSYWLGLSSVDD